MNEPKKLLSPLTSSIRTSTLLDAGDGSGDGILELSDELLARMGWREGDMLDVSQAGDGSIRLTKKSTAS